MKAQAENRKGQVGSDTRLRRLRRRFSASLSLKLIGIFVGGSVALAVLMGGLAQFGLDRQFLSTARPLLDHYVLYLAKEVGSPPSVRKARVLTDNWPIIIRIFDSERNIRWASDGRESEPATRRFSDSQGVVRQPHRARFAPVYWDHGTVLLKRKVATATVYYGIKVRPEGAPWFPILFISLVLLGLFGFYWLTRRLFAPIKIIQEGISKIGDGQLSHRIEMNRSDELGLLAEHVNSMAGQFESMLQARRDLLLAISHELKSPMARSRVTLALLEDSGYQRALLGDQVEMQELIDGIIDAERTQGDYSLLHRRATDIKKLIKDLVFGSEPFADIELNLPPDSMHANVDASQIQRLLRNLLENALRHNRRDQGPVKLQARLKNQELILLVSDHGLGIEAQHIGRLTEAFYRVDASRERSSGGLGLGLYLCQAVINAHAGKMKISSRPGFGTRVECRMPING